jgi:folate-dependent phosphoribosylglycinamide formyltransferase PurN
LGITPIHLPYKDGIAFEQELLIHLKSHNIDLLALAGFLKLLSDAFCKYAAIPILNIHPALLPAYGGKGMYGMAVHEAVYAKHEKISGATIHMVDPIYDHGRIIAQKEANVSHCQSPQEVATEVLKVEHKLYGRAIREFLGL